MSKWSSTYVRWCFTQTTFGLNHGYRELTLIGVPQVKCPVKEKNLFSSKMKHFCILKNFPRHFLPYTIASRWTHIGLEWIGCNLGWLYNMHLLKVQNIPIALHVPSLMRPRV